MGKTLGPLLKRWRYTKSSDFAEIELTAATVRFLTRYGLLDAGSSDAERRTQHRRMLTDISRASGDATGIVAAWLELFAAGEYGSLEDGICGETPQCGVCALKDRCRYLVANARDERVSGANLAQRLQAAPNLRDGGLSGSEFLAFLLHHRTCGAADFARAEAALKAHGGLRGLFDASEKDIAALGYDKDEHSRLRALAGLCSHWAEERVERGKKFSNAKDFYDYFHLRLRDLKKEVFYVALLDQQNRLIGEELVSQGTLTDTVVHPREVFALAVKLRAAGVAVVHNHPSGDPKPSANDKSVTRRLASTAELLQIRLLDHIIVGDGCYTSFVDSGLLP
jgi:DNA repair protein RadC